MADIYKGELQDNLGNTVYPHTESDVVFCADGETAQEKLAKYENALGSVTGKTDSLEVDDTNILATSKAVKQLNNSLERLKTYSTEEKVVGTWINDKPLYRKVITVNNFLWSSGTTLAHNIQNAEFVMCKNYIFDDNGAIYGDFSLVDSKGNGNFYTNTESIIFVGSSSWSASSTRTWYFVLEYTKTTD